MKMTKRDEEEVKQFEDTNCIEDINYLFATAGKKGIKIFGKVDDEFLHDLVFAIMADNPKIAEAVMDSVLETVSEAVSFQQDCAQVNKH